MKYEISPKETEIRASWDEAKMYCFSLNIDGKIGWRLPTTEELHNMLMTGTNFTFKYWTTERDTNHAWFMNTKRILSENKQPWLKFTKQVVKNYCHKNNLMYVRAVRDLKDY